MKAILKIENIGGDQMFKKKWLMGMMDRSRKIRNGRYE